MNDQIENCYLDPNFSAADCCWEFNIIAVVVDVAVDVAVVVAVVVVSHR